MKKTGKILALALALSLVCMLMAGCSVEISIDGAAPAVSGAPFAQVDETHWAGGALTILGVEYAPEFTDQGYVDSTLFTSVSKILYDGGEIAVDNTLYTPILTVDGVQYDLYNAENVSYEGDVQITLVEKGDSNANQGAPFGADKAQSSFGPFYYTAAAYIGDGVYDEAKSVTAAQIEGEITDTEANGLVVDSQGDYFSGLYINNSDYTVNDASIHLVGAAGDDFNGWGHGIVALGSSTVDINRSYIYGTGVLRSGLFASGNALVNVNDSVIITENDNDEIPYDTEDNYATPMMQQCPFGLGITGNIRATLACGAGCNTFTNSLVASDGWAVLSTDSGRAGTTALVSNAMVAVVGQASRDELPTADFSYDVNGETWYVDVGEYGEESGYIAYADAGVLDYAYGSAWYSPDYLGIITSGTIEMLDGSYGYAGRIGFMSHSGGGAAGHGTLTVKDSRFDIQDIFVVTQLSGTYTTTTTIDNAEVSLAPNGNSIYFLQLASDDNAGGPGNTSNVITDLSYEEYLVCEAASGEPGVTASELVISNSVVQGDIFNASTTEHVGLNIALDATEVQGAMSSAWTYHVDANGEKLDSNTINCDYYTGTRDGENGIYDYTMYLRVKAETAPTVNNPVSVTMTNGSKWMVTGTNYISSLTIDDSSTIAGMGLVMTVDGVETAIEPGSYTGEIILTAGEAPARGEGDAEIEAPALGEAAAITVEAPAAEEPAAVPADAEVIEYVPFEVAMPDGAVLSFDSMTLTVTDSTATIAITGGKTIDCVIENGEWIMADADFFDEAIIASVKAGYEGTAAPATSEEPASAEPASAEPAAEGSSWDAWIAYLTGLIDDKIADIADMVAGELAVAKEEDYTGMLDGTVFGVFAFTYDAIPYEEFSAGAPAAEGEEFPRFDEYKAYLYETLMKDTFWQGNEASLTAALEAATSPADESIQNFTGSGAVDQAPVGVVFPMTYDVWFAAN